MNSQLELLPTPTPRASMLAQARSTEAARRGCCLARYGKGVYYERAKGSLRLYRGRTVVAEALAKASAVPGALDAVGWVLRRASDWHTLAMMGKRGQSGIVFSDTVPKKYFKQLALALGVF